MKSKRRCGLKSRASKAGGMDTEDRFELDEIEPLTQAFRDQLLACLEECATGRRGLFSDHEHRGGEDGSFRAWPEAARLRELAFALQAILAQAGVADSLCDQF